MLQDNEIELKETNHRHTLLFTVREEGALIVSVEMPRDIALDIKRAVQIMNKLDKLIKNT